MSRGYLRAPGILAPQRRRQRSRLIRHTLLPLACFVGGWVLLGMWVDALPMP